MKKFLLSIFFTFSFFVTPFIASADTVLLEYFGRDDCGHCKDQAEFLESIEEKYDFEVRYYNILTEEESAELFDQVTQKAGLSKTTPLTWVGNTFVQGFNTAATTGVRMEALIQASTFNETVDLQTYLASDVAAEIESVEGGSCDENGEECLIPTSSEFLFEVPFIGVVDVSKWSLPTMSIILGFIDGFNPCAMWVLIMFLLALSQAGSVTRMIQVAGIFIMAEAIMYYLILNVWMTTWDFVGLDKIVTPIVGTLAIGGAIFFFYEAYTYDGTCKVISLEKQRGISKKIQEYAESPMTWMVFFGVTGLAFSVNIIEFACSVGIPQAFTKILDINLLTWMEKQWYMFLYILFYMVDDFIVFGLAVFAFDKIHGMHKYTVVTSVIGGLVMLLLGALMLLRPDLLVF